MCRSLSVVELDPILLRVCKDLLNRSRKPSFVLVEKDLAAVPYVHSMICPIPGARSVTSTAAREIVRTHLEERESKRERGREMVSL